MPAPTSEPSYRGERLGLPASGPGSLATFGRRVIALLIDLACAYVIAYAFFPDINVEEGLRFANPIASNLIFIIVQILFIPTIGGSPGHRLLGMRVMRVDGAWTGLWRPIVRTILLVLVIPAVVWDGDGRGLHDKAAGTVLVRS